MKKKRKTAGVFFAPFALCFVLFWLVPFVYGCYLSVCNMSLTRGNQGFIGLGNYIQIFTAGSVYSEAFFRGLKNILIFVVTSVPLLVIIALVLALIVESLPEKVKGIYRTIYFMSYAVSVTAVSAVFLWLFNGNGGYINNVLLSAGLINEPVSWLEAQPFAWIVLVVATVWWTVGYNMMLFINALNSIDSALFEAVAVDGGGFFSRLRYIILPGIRNVMAYVILMTIIASFNMYG